MNKTRRPRGKSHPPRSTPLALPEGEDSAQFAHPTTPGPDRTSKRSQITVNFLGNDLDDIRARAKSEGSLATQWIRDKAVKALRGIE